MKFNAKILGTVLGSQSVLDLPQLDLQGLDQAYEFLRAYGFDIKNPSDEEKLWDYYRRALSFISSELLTPDMVIPDSLADPHQLKDLRYLLIYASTTDSRPQSLKKWACAILKVMHVLAHVDNDLFTAFSREIQEQILKPFQDNIFEDPVSGPQLGLASELETIPLKKFEIKLFKTSDSSILKLLAKRDVIAFGLLDKIGVRFVTKTVFDVFRVLQMLAQKSLVSFPHVAMGHSHNNLYPLNLFLDALETWPPDRRPSGEEIDRTLHEKLRTSGDQAEYVIKPSDFSSAEYQFAKFISRRLVRVDHGGSQLSFFYPFEVQIVDYETHLKNMSGPSAHKDYKDRQRQRARLRVFGELE
jgi:uncharacterized protein (TIGR04552 family)